MAALVSSLEIDLLLDVGANEGQFARAMRRHGYGGPILSFEPVASAFAVAAAHADHDPAWEVRRLAIGAEPGEATIHVAANSGQSSSVLPMLDRHAAAAPEATYVGTEQVQVRRLDDIVDVPGHPRLFLKVDTQGFEDRVLTGAGRLLADRIVGLQLELSLVPLYDGGPLYRDLLEQTARAGFRLTGVVPGFADRRTGEMLQFDGVFVRTEDTR